MSILTNGNLREGSLKEGLEVGVQLSTVKGEPGSGNSRSVEGAGEVGAGSGCSPGTEAWEQLEWSGWQADWVRVSAKNSGVC